MIEKKGWSNDATSDYLRIAEVIIPGRQDILSLISKLATAFFPNQLRVLDVGCGSGDVSAEILKLRPDASICMVDFSDEMVRLARERFSDKSNVEVINYDLNVGIPESLKPEEFNAIVSCFAIHHVAYENRPRLYSGLRRVLSHGGLFINGDRFIAESPIIAQWEFDYWIEWMVAQIRRKLSLEQTFERVKRDKIKSDEKKGDAPGTLWDMRRNLKEVGFKNVDCLWKSHTLGVIVATNP